jgi:predicted DNA-binding protein with PD1-like motif
MEYAAGTVGRVFLIRVDHGEDLLAAITTVAGAEGVGTGLVLLLGALETGRMVEGPATPAFPPVQVLTAFADGREVLGVGNMVCEEGRPVVHLHAATGRAGLTAVGCVRGDARVYATVEVVLLELAVTATRCCDAETGLSPIVFRP